MQYIIKVVVGVLIFWLAYVPLRCINSASGSLLDGIDTAMTMLSKWGCKRR